MPLPLIRVKRPIPQQRTNNVVHAPAPVGGINTVSVASAMPATDCLQLFNMIPHQYGLRTRSGWREWATTLKKNYQGQYQETLTLSDAYSVAHT